MRIGDFSKTRQMIGIRKKWSYKFFDISILAPDWRESFLSRHIDAP
jgi:hypothetical protein